MTIHRTDVPATTSSGRGASTAARMTFAVTLAAGLAHAGSSLYWALGGTALLDTVGDEVVDAVRAEPALVATVVVGKALLALLPIRLWRARPLRRPVTWVISAAALGMAAWGLLNTVAGGLVLVGVVDPTAAVDRAALAGHVILWDPLFVVWGTGLLVLLRRSRRGAGTMVGGR